MPTPTPSTHRNEVPQRESLNLHYGHGGFYSRLGGGHGMVRGDIKAVFRLAQRRRGLMVSDERA
jgi:hypothetical protein